ncbi:hypothetical protein HS7_13270 [Sulfolobales archaeon HS-7]|nr:hypothetical protein HS7_13270 [Sulfolobales archaeon HS-7]
MEGSEVRRMGFLLLMFGFIVLAISYSMVGVFTIGIALSGFMANVSHIQRGKLYDFVLKPATQLIISGNASYQVTGKCFVNETTFSPTRTDSIMAFSQANVSVFTFSNSTVVETGIPFGSVFIYAEKVLNLEYGNLALMLVGGLLILFSKSSKDLLQVIAILGIVISVLGIISSAYTYVIANQTNLSVPAGGNTTIDFHPGQILTITGNVKVTYNRQPVSVTIVRMEENVSSFEFNSRGIMTIRNPENEPVSVQLSVFNLNDGVRIILTVLAIAGINTILGIAFIIMSVLVIREKSV